MGYEIYLIYLSLGQAQLISTIQIASTEFIGIERERERERERKSKLLALAECF
jgi:hypothetical protein